MNESRNRKVEPVAIVGIGCRFPGSVDDAQAFWSLLIEGRSGIRDVPADRWSLHRFYHPDPATPGAMVMRRGGFVDGLATFDAAFWNISPREALRMDPQQRWLLEVAWEAIEDAGVAPSRLRGRRVGVFVGISGNDYGGLQLRNTEDVDAYTNSGATASIASNRISYMLDLRGPSLSIDTACSSSLVTVSAACESIWSGQSEAALAGGVNALISPQTSVGFSKASMISPTGDCFAFDARANGFVRAEGAALVLLKPLSAALADGDRIYAVIRAVVVNQDGHTSSMTVPGLDGQTSMLEEAYRLAGVPPERVAYVEAHGTGTPVGDPIEAAALGRVLGRHRDPQAKCLIGSVKTNIGHLESASGIAGLIKAALVLFHRTIPATLTYEQPNPAIPFDELRLEVTSHLRSLPVEDGVLAVAGVNSFGFGGTNAHAVLEAAPEVATTTDEQIESTEGPFLLPISARDETALRQYVHCYRELVADPAYALADVCAAAGARKEHHSYRLTAIGRTRDELRRQMAAWLRDGVAEGIVAGRQAPHTPPVFVFAGQGPQWWAMGRQLLEREPVFRRTLLEIEELVQGLAGWSLIAEMSRSEADSIIDQTHIAQPAIFALQIGLVDLWKTWGIRPAKVIGHSVGEVAAAYCAGIYSLADAVAIIVHRSRLQHRAFGGGRMLAVALSAEEAHAAIGDDDRVELAAVNSPRLMTLAGESEALKRLDEQLQGSGVFTRWLRSQYAFHSAQMDPIREELLLALDRIDPRPEKIPFISTVTGSPLAGASLNASYWWQNIRRPVLFGPAVATSIRDGDRTFLEVSPHPVLESAVKECLAADGETGSMVHSLRRGVDESEELATNLAGLHVLGMPLDWMAVNRGRGRFVQLPHYPWQREKFWIESRESARIRLEPAAHPLLGQRIESAIPTWQTTLDLCRLKYLKDHRIWNSVVFPASAYGEIGLALGRLLMPEERHSVERLEIKKALFLRESEPTVLQTVFDPADKSFGIYSSNRENPRWELHAQGTLMRATVTESSEADLAVIQARLSDRIDRDRYCHELSQRGYEFGPAFTQVKNIWRRQDEVLVQIEAPDEVAVTADAYLFHPAIQDACFHGLLGLVRADDDTSRQELFLPESVGRLDLRVERAPSRLWAHAFVGSHDAASITSDIFVYDEHGAPVANVLGFRIELVEEKQAVHGLDDCYYTFEWEPRRLRGSGIHGPCAFATSDTIVASVRAALPDVAQRCALDEYHDRFVPEAEAAAFLLEQRAFRNLGWQPEIGEQIELHSFMARLGIVEEYGRVTRRLLHRFERRGLLRLLSDDTWEVMSSLEGVGAEMAVEALTTKYPALTAETDLFRRTGLNLASVLHGESDPLELLFPGGSHDPVERFYAEALGFPAHLELTRTTVEAALASFPAERAIRVLEVGAGTGTLTRAVLPALPAHRTEYLFSDLGAAFVAAARKRFAEVPFIDYQLFDVETDPHQQGIPAGHFDLILAADVIHATADVKVALTHLRRCLAPGGLLVLLELANPDIVRDDVTFGLLKGYSRFTDTQLRPWSALMDPDRWRQTVAECGFGDVQVIGCRTQGNPEHAIIIGFAPASQGAPASAVEISPGNAPFVIFADETGVGTALAARLRDRGYDSMLVRRDDLGRPRLKSVAGVIHCWALDHPVATNMTVEELRSSQQTGLLSGFDVVRAVADDQTRVWFVTRDAQSVTSTDRNTAIAATTLTGLVRVANNEHKCRFATIDLDASAPDVAAGYLVDEILLPADGEFEIAYRERVRHVQRLKRVSAEKLPRRLFNAVASDGTVEPFRLETNSPGILANLALHQTRRTTPSPKEIEVRVRAAGINFRDVMKALGTHPGNPADLLWLGNDFSGTVERVGSEVTGFRPGDRVAGMAPYAFQSFATTDPRTVFRLPAQLTFEQAASIPTVFLTAHYALNHLAQMQSGESILIHAGTGGVGQAAIQIAKHLSLRIFATAGTPEKRQMLRAAGVEHVMSSRTLDFADEIMDVTKGRGVDAVLNSLAGDFIPKSLSVLATFGRFLEIGKVDVYRNTRIGLHPLRNNISYFVIDLTQHLQHKREFVRRVFEEIRARFESGDYEPVPITTFPITAAVDAFRFMAQGKHVGKNVLTFDLPNIPIALSSNSDQRFKPDATYLITGGAGGLGLEVAKWIAAHGGRHLVLMSRTGPRDPAASAAIDALIRSGTTVIDARGDVASSDDVRRVIDHIFKEMPPLKGIFHAAMVLDDGLIIELDERRIRAALEPKMTGAWNLHVATAKLPLDYFVCFSSFSAVIGLLRQSNYNAGNAFLDALARYRRGLGLPSLTINWGAILGTGFVERNQKITDALVRLGFGSFDTSEALRVLDRLLVAGAVNVVAARFDWQAVLKLSPLAAASNTYAALTQETHTAQKGRSLDAQLRESTPDQQQGLLESFIVSQVAGVFGIADDKVSRTARLTDLGLDSLMTLELTNRVERELGVRIPMSSLLSGPTITELARTVRQLLPLAPPATESLADVDRHQQGVADDTAEGLGTSDPKTAALETARHIVTIKTGTDVPLFCFHPVGGGVAIYAGLSDHLPTGLPVYGVESRVVDERDEYSSLDEMLDAYVSAIRDAHVGPYRLFGFSLGGYLAACTAERLEASGDPVEFVGVIDWDARQKVTASAQRDSLIRLSVASYLFIQDQMGILRPRPEAELHEEISRLVDVIFSQRSGGEVFYQWVVDNELTVTKALEDVARQYLARFEQHCRLLTHGLPQPKFSAPLIVWRASRGFGSPLHTWDHSGTLSREYVFEGDHNALMRAASLRNIAEQMMLFIEETARGDVVHGHKAAELA